MTSPEASIFERAHAVLTEPDPNRKIELSTQSVPVGATDTFLNTPPLPPSRPNRPQHPVLLSPNRMPRRSAGQKGRIALIHALAHIELNAIDLAWDMVLRFGPGIQETQFVTDWVTVAQEEAQHFQMLCSRLVELEHVYGDMPAHDGLWQAAAKTSHHVLDRLAVIPMFLEARGIDTAPVAVERLIQAGDRDTASVLEHIYTDEIKHLRTGVFWFEKLCADEGHKPISLWKELVQTHLRAGPKGPFNRDGRLQAGMSPAYWET